MTKKTIFNIFKNLFFLFLGIILFLWVYKGYDIKQLFNELRHFNPWFVILSIIFSILSNISRALRWNMLLEPMGYKFKTFNAFLSIQVMYLANLAVPRAGEIVRCSILSKYENMPFTKLIGTVIIERFVDALALFIIAFGALITQVGTLKRFFANNPESLKKIQNIFSVSNLIILLVIILIGIIMLIIFRKNLKNNKIYLKIKGIFDNILEGLKTVLKLKNPWLFIGHTIFIYIMWLLMLYVFFIGFPATKELGIFSAVTVFVMSGLAMIAPVQAGIGAYHFMVASTLLLYGVSFELGKSFAFIIHTCTNLYLAVFGLFSFIILYFYNRKKSGNNS